MTTILMAFMLSVLTLQSELFRVAIDEPSKTVNNANNVAGSMPNPNGNPMHGVVFVGTMTSSNECENVALANVDATSWTYHHCDFPPAKSGNYSCHCYIRTDFVWKPKEQALVDSGDLHNRPTNHCTTNSGCQLNGRCVAGICECDPTWTGDHCERLHLLPAAESNGLDDPVYSSWGGSVLYNTSDDTWHMFAAVIEQGCGLKAWRPNSAIGHATSSVGPAGPYLLQRFIKPHFAHEPVALWTTDGTIAIYHIGAGTNDTGPHSNYAHNCSHHCTGDGHKWIGGGSFVGPTSILHSKSFDGPWTSLDIGNCSQLANCEHCGDTNPAPILLPDGSVEMMWRTTNVDDCPGQSCMAAGRAPSWRGPYTWNISNLFANQTTKHIEDAHQWRAPSDAANPGSYHAVFHSDVEASCGGAAGGHAYSLDGIAWTFSQYNAFGNTVDFENGTTITLRQRERPHLVLDQTGHPIVLTNGAGYQNDCDHVFTLAQPIKH
eukprot:m.15181 g.15181  ORF g.15181 m.15181 type:complete len:490 (-) comp10471_c0_seq1:134-1603(-)